MRRKWISLLLAASMALSPSYLFPGAAMALTEQDDSGYSTYECEDGEVLGNAVVSTSFSGYTGDGSVVCGMVPVQGVTLSNVTVPEEGDYTVLIRYGQSNWSARTMYVYANGNEADAQQVVFPKLKSWGLWDQIPVTVHLNAGENTLTVASGAGDSGDVVLDNVAVSDAPMVMTQVPVPNGGFESGDTTNWTVDNLSNVGYGVDQPDAFGGDYKFYFYTTSNFEGRLHQTVTGLPEGTYQVNATVKMSNGRQQASRMELSGYDGDAATQVEIPYNGGYERYSSQVEVKDGQLTIAFYCLGNAHTSMQIDNVELWKIDSTAPSETYAVQVADGQEATLSAPAEAALGETVTVSVSGLPAGKTVQAVKAVDADGTALQVVEVARDKTYSFVMPAKAVTLSVELTDVSDVAKAIVSRDTVTRIEAEDYDEQAGVNVESCSDIGGGQNVGSIDAGDYMLYHNIYVEDAGTYQFRLRVASNNTDGGVEGSPDGVTIVTTAAPEGVVGTVPFTGAWQTYTDVYLDVPLDAGFQTIRFNATHEGWNINYFDIQMGAKAVVTPEGVTKIEAEDFDGQGGDPAMGDKAGIKTEPCGEDSTENIGSTDAGDYFYYDDILVMEAGTYQFTLRVASNNTDGGVQGSPDGVSIVTTAAPDGVTASIPHTGGWQSYTDVKVLVPLEAGRQTIRFNVTHEGWNINYFTIALPVEVPSYESVSIRNRWNNQYLYDDNSGLLRYGDEMPSDDRDPYTWDFLPDDEGYYTIQNKATGNYMVNDGSGFVACVAELPADDTGKWVLRTVDGYFKINSLADDALSIALENQDEEGRVELTEAPDSWYSAHYTLNSTRFDYDIYPDKIVDGAYTMTAEDGEELYSSYENRTWRLTEDISELPQYTAENMPISEALYNLTMQEVLENIFTEKSHITGEPIEVFYTGANWPKVWTRDTAMSVQYALAWALPEQSGNSLLQKIQGDPREWTEDTGTGGSYPNSTDRIIMALAGWEIYLATGDTEFLETIYDVTAYTLEKDLHVAYDPNTGLFKGETSGLDHRSKTYPDWMDEGYFSDIMESKASGTNIEYAVAFKVLEQASEILGKDPAETEKWANRFEDLKQAINENFWVEDGGYYASWQYPEYMGNVLAEKTDVIATGYAIYYDIATPEMAERLMENYPLVKYGANTVYPQKRGKQFGAIYHNRGVWPGWEATLMEGAMKAGNHELADEIMKSIMSAAARNLSNEEVINYETGAGNDAHRQLWSVAGHMASFYRVLFGMTYELDGIHFAPYVPDWMVGPFELSNYTYRDANLTVTVSGQGDQVASLKVNGEEMGADYVLPANASGDYTIEIVVEDSGDHDSVNLKPENLAICPEPPEMQLEDGVLTWTPDESYTYKLWTGTEYIDVTGKDSYEIPQDVYGSYSLVAVDEDGIAGELSEPIIWNPEGTYLTYEAEDAEFDEACFANSIQGYSGTGYVQDNRPNGGTDITFTVNVPKEGDYLVSALYNNGGNTTDGNYAAIRSVIVDGEDYGTMSFSITFENVFYRSPRMRMHLTEGEHTITFSYNYGGNNYDQNMNINRNNLAMDQLILENIRSEGSVTAEPQLLTVQWSGNASMSVEGNAEAIISTDAIYGAKVQPGEELVFTFTPTKDGFSGAQLNGEDIEFAADGCTYTFTMPGEGTTLRFTFTSVDKSILGIVLEEANAVPQDVIDSLVPSAKEFFENALAKAQEVYDDAAATEEEVKEAWSDLLDAMHLLEFEAGDKETLLPLINIAEQLKDMLDQFKPGTTEGFEEALDAAKDVYAEENPLKADVDEAYDNLQAAIDKLEMRADMSILQNTVDEANGLDLNLYIDDEAMAAFKTVLAEAEELLLNADAGQADVDAKAEALTRAMAALRKIPNKDELNKLIAEMEQKDLDGYTDRSVAAFKAALSVAKTVAADANADEQAVAKAYTNLEAAANNLVKAEKPSTGNSGKGSTSANVGNAYGAAGVVSAAQGVASQQAYVVSDTTVNFTLKRGSAYCFKMTVVNGNNMVPNFTAGNGEVLKTQFVAKIGNDYYYRVYATGTPGQSTGVYTTLPGQNAVKHCTVTIA